MSFPLKVGKMHFRHMEKIRLKVCMRWSRKCETHVCNRFQFQIHDFFFNSVRSKVCLLGVEMEVWEKGKIEGDCA